MVIACRQQRRCGKGRHPLSSAAPQEEVAVAYWHSLDVLESESNDSHDPSMDTPQSALDLCKWTEHSGWSTALNDDGLGIEHRLSLGWTLY
jgi:hypothetical protein